MLKFLANRFRAAWRVDLDQAVKPLRKDVQLLSEEVQRLRRALEAHGDIGDVTAAHLSLIRQLNDEQTDLLASLPSILDEPRILSHVRHAIANATINTDPLDYIVVERLLPDDVYDLLLRAIPPVEFFSAEDPIKQNIPLPMHLGPALTMRVWNFMDESVAGKAILPATLEKLHAPLQEHYDTIFGPEARERANQLPRRGSGGRLMLRRPGYHLAPHRDPKRSLITCLMYLAKPGDSERYGTQLFRVPDEQEPNCKQTYYPEANGQTCTLEATVPFKPNSMLAFVNSRGAHGATIPHDAPADLERYSYQFYVAPEPEALSTLVKQLPKSRRAMWQSKDKMPQPAYS
jgi:hypothetical protein